MTTERQQSIFCLVNSLAGEIIFWRSEMNRCGKEHGSQSKTFKEAWRVLSLLEMSQKPLELMMLDFETIPVGTKNTTA